MTIFALMLPTAEPRLAEKIAEVFPADHLRVSDTQWLVSSGGTTQDISAKLGISDGTSGAAIVLAVSSYFGRAPTNIWEWMKVKLEAPPHG